MLETSIELLKTKQSQLTTEEIEQICDALSIVSEARAAQPDILIVFQLAVIHNISPIALKIIDMDIDINVTFTNLYIKPDQDNASTPLNFAATYGRIDIMAALLDKGANINLGTSSQRKTPLMAAALGGHIEAVNFLRKNGAIHTIKSLWNATVLHYAVLGQSIPVIDLFLDLGLNIDDVVTKSKSSVITMAIMSCSVEVLKHLIARGANIKDRPEEGIMPLGLAVSEGKPFMVRELVKATQNYDPESEDILCLKIIATRMGERKILRALDNPDDDLTDSSTDTISQLIQAIEADEYSKASSLINPDTVNGRDKYGWPAVFTAFSTPNMSATILAGEFLRKRVDVNILGPFDVNLLMMAINNNFLHHVMSLSTEPGIDLEHQDVFGTSSLDLAKLLGNTQCQAVIERAISMAPVSEEPGCKIM